MVEAEKFGSYDTLRAGKSVDGLDKAKSRGDLSETLATRIKSSSQELNAGTLSSSSGFKYAAPSGMQPKV